MSPRRLGVWCRIAALAASAAPAVLAQPPPASAPQGFDGRWAVSVTCDAVMARGKMVQGEASNFFVDVKQGRLEGQHGTPGAAGSMRYVGTIGADGTAKLIVTGHTGSADATAGAADPAGAYSYAMRGNFDGASGNAVRSEFRPCRARFEKQ